MAHFLVTTDLASCPAPLQACIRPRPSTPGSWAPTGEALAGRLRGAGGTPVGSGALLDDPTSHMSPLQPRASQVCSSHLTLVRKSKDRELPGGPVVRTQWLHCCSLGSIPSLGTEIPPQATAHHGQNHRKSQDELKGRNEVLLVTSRQAGVWHGAGHATPWGLHVLRGGGFRLCSQRRAAAPREVCV